MNDKKPNIFTQIKNKVYFKKYQNAIDETIEWVNNNFDNEEGFFVQCSMPDANNNFKKITPNNFESAFHENIWLSMPAGQKLLALMWFDTYLAKKYNRQEAGFDLESGTGQINFFKDEYNNISFIIPVETLEDEDWSCYNILQALIRFNALAKSYDRLDRFNLNGEIIDLDQAYLKAFGKHSNQPNCYAKLVTEKKLISAEELEMLTDEEREQINKPQEALTEEEVRELLTYLLHPFYKEYKDELKIIHEIASRNDTYIGEDSFYNEFARIQKLQHKIEDEYINSHVQNKDRNQVFLKLMEEDENLQQDGVSEK